MEPVLDGLRTVEVELLAEPELLKAGVYIYIRFALILQKKNLFQIFTLVCILFIDSHTVGTMAWISC